MRKCIGFFFSSAVLASAIVFSAAPASALSLAPGAASPFAANDSLVETIVLRRRAPVRRTVRRGGGFNPGAAAVIGLGVAGVAAAIIANERRDRDRDRRQQFYQQQQQPYGYGYAQPGYYQQQPACGYQEQPVYDRFGNYRGTRQVQACQ
jgi:hypothetical protein